MLKITKKTALLMAMLTLGLTVSAYAERGRVVVIPRHFGYYEPYWRTNPYWGGYPYGYYFPNVGPGAEMKMEVRPKQAAVYVDGYYAGVAADFGGIFRHLATTAGGHSITFYLDGYRTATQHVYIRPGTTMTMQEQMEPLAAGESSTPPPAPNPVEPSGGHS